MSEIVYVVVNVPTSDDEDSELLRAVLQLPLHGVEKISNPGKSLCFVQGSDPADTFVMTQPVAVARLLLERVSEKQEKGGSNVLFGRRSWAPRLKSALLWRGAACSCDADSSRCSLASPPWKAAPNWKAAAPRNLLPDLGTTRSRRSESRR
jgi:hypothetical protein